MATELLTPQYWSIHQLFKYRFHVPVYQRPYSWQKEQIGNLLDDMLDSFESFKSLGVEEQQKFNFYIGNIIIHKKAFELYEIIDGQQRITSFAIMLLSLYSHLYELGINQNDRILIKIQQSLWKLDTYDSPIKDKRVIELGSIDKQILVDIFNEAFLQPEKLCSFVKNYQGHSPFELNVKDNYFQIYNFVKEKILSSSTKVNDVLQFANFVLNKVYLIAIINEDSEFKAFSIFESINGKGKKLEDIDLIKTRIFSYLNESDYSSYLTKWGNLIIDTEDRLYNYLKIHIKSNIKYYSGNISFSNFKGLDSDICIHYGKSNLGEAYKDMIDDMVSNVNCFKALFDLNTALGIVNNKKFRFYYSVYTKIQYEHPWPLFYKCFCEFLSEKLSKDDLILIMIEIIKFSIVFLTISGKDSKDAISLFSTIFEAIFIKRSIDKDFILYQIKNKRMTTGIRKDDIIFSLRMADVFNKNKFLGVAMLSIYESKYLVDNVVQISWDEAYSKFSSYGVSYTLDHIMNQTPATDDGNLKYYKLGNNLKLKDGHDFPEDLVHDEMDYDSFKTLILHRVGNLRLKGGDGNSSRGNTSERDFCTYKQLEKRNDEICFFFALNVLEFVEEDKAYSPEVLLKNKRKKISGNFNFAMKNLDLTGTKPKSITIEGNSFHISTLKDILTTIVKYAFKCNREKLIQIAKNEWSPRTRIIITDRKEKLKCYYPIIDNQIYLETNLSARDIIYYATQILIDFGIERSKVLIFIPE